MKVTPEIFKLVQERETYATIIEDKGLPEDYFDVEISKVQEKINAIIQS